MDKNFKQSDIEKARQFANTSAGHQLLTQLQKIDSASFDAAIKQANAGNYSELSKTLAHLLASDEARKILSQFGGK